MQVYKISGDKRRQLKKELSLSKHYLKMNPHYTDIDKVYGCYNEEFNNTYTNKLQNRIKELTILLDELR